MNICKRIKIWFQLVYCLLMTPTSLKANILNEKDTIDYLIDRKLSLIRFGDGEFNLFLKQGVHYQPYSTELETELNNIVENYNKDGTNLRILLALPNQYFNTNIFYLSKKRVLVSCWSRPRYIYKKKFNNKNLYGEAFLFAKENEEYYSKLWRNEENIIFIHSNKECFNHFNKKYNNKNCYFVKIDSFNCYRAIKQIEDNINIIVKENNLNKIELRILVSAGPAAKVLTFNLTNKGFIVYDTGHCWDEPLIII